MPSVARKPSEIGWDDEWPTAVEPVEPVWPLLLWAGFVAGLATAVALAFTGLWRIFIAEHSEDSADVYGEANNIWAPGMPWFLASAGVLVMLLVLEAALLSHALVTESAR